MRWSKTRPFAKISRGRRHFLGVLVSVDQGMPHGDFALGRIAGDLLFVVGQAEDWEHRYRCEAPVARSCIVARNSEG